MSILRPSLNPDARPLAALARKTVMTNGAPAPGPIVPGSSPAITLTQAADSPLFGSRLLEAELPLLPFQANSDVADQYRLIRTRIVRHPLEPRVIQFTSPGQGDGKTVNAINVAAMLSMAKDADVLLIGGDAHGDLGAQLGLDPAPGLTNVLAGEVRIQRAIVTTVQYPNLYILTCGTNPREMPELLNSAGWQAVVRYARASFKYVVIDAPPCGLVADYYLLESAADGVVLVVRPDHTNRRMLRNALEEVPRQKFLGVLMNSYRDYIFWRRLDYYGRPWE